uniref:Ribonuclease H-like domain-containing protein n=1 Tax=Tanacetum cinerariifolium TaxID=118510 RepID=A0A6L2L4A1_TANCI|nr:ribonuclease H-like domain-containing protein [Tanacetum cinerariifolium]
MEILLEPTSNKFMVAGNIIMEILFKLNLPDHRILKDGGEGACFHLSQRFIAACSYPTIKLQVPSPASPKEPTRKSKRVKRPAKKTFDASVSVQRIDLVSEVALTEEAQHEEVCKKSLKDFYKTHPSVYGTVTKITPSAAKIKPSVTNEGICTKPRVPNVTEKESTKSEANYWGRDKDDSNNDHDSRSEGINKERDSGDDNTQSHSEKWSNSKHETDENELGSKSDQEENEKEIEDDKEKEEDKFVKTPSNNTDDEDETKIKDKTEGDEDKGMNYTTNQFDDDVNVRMNEPITTDEEFIQKEDISHIDAEIVSPIDVHVHHEQQSTPTPPPTTKATNPLSTLPNFASTFQFNNIVTTLEKEEPEFEVAVSDMPQDQEKNPGNDDEEPKRKNIVLKGNSAKSMTTDKDGNLKIHPPVTAEEHQQVQRKEKARLILLSALPDEHMGDFYHMIDARDIWNAIKARFGRNAESKKMQKSLLKQKFKEFKIYKEEGLDKGYDKMQKILSQMNTLKIKPEPEDIDTKGYSSSSSTISNAAFVSTTGSSQGKLSYQKLGNDGYGGYTTTLSASLGSSSSKGSSKSKCSVVDDVIYSFFTNHEIDQQLVYEDLDQINKEEFEEYDLKHQMAMLSIKVHRFEKKHGRKIKFNGRENARFDKKLVKCFNCKKMGHFSRECRAQGGQNSNNYQKYKEAGKDGTDSKAMVVVDGNADSEGEVVSADDVTPAVVFVSTGLVAAAVDSLHSETEFAFIGLSTEVSIPVTCPLCCDSKYKLIEKDYHKQREHLNDYVVDLKAHKHAVKSLEKQIKCHQMNQLAYEEKIKVLSYEIEEKSNILEYRQKLIDQATQEKQELMSKLENEIANQAKWNNSGRNLYKLIDSSMSVRTKRGLGVDKYIRKLNWVLMTLNLVFSTLTVMHWRGQPIYNRDTIVIDCARQEDFPSVRTSSIETDVKSSKTLSGQPNPISADQPNPFFAGQPNTVSAGDGILSLGPLNIQSKSTYFHSFTHNNHQIFFLITHNSLYLLYLTGGLNGKTVVKPSAGWPWIKYGMSKTKGSKINGGSKSKSWSFAKGPLDRPKLEKAKDKGIVDSGCSRSMSGNKDKLEDFKDFHGGEVTFGGSTGKITKKGTIKTNNLNFENVLYVKELQHFNLISVSQICDQSHRVLFTKNECLVLSKYFPLPDPSMVILSIPRKNNLYTFSLNELPPKGPLTCLIAKASQNESTLWNRILGHVNFRNMNKLVKGTGQAWMFDINYLTDSLNYFRVSSTNLTAGSQGATPSNAELQALQKQEQASKEEADRLGLAFPSLNPMLGFGTSSISSSVSAGSTPSVSAGSTPQMSLYSFPISTDQHSSAAGKCHVPAGRPTGSAGRPVCWVKFVINPYNLSTASF